MLEVGRSHALYAVGCDLHAKIAGGHATCSRWHARCAVLCTLEVVEDMRHMLEVLNARWYVLDMLEVVEAMLEVVDGTLCVLCVMKVVLCVPLRVLEAVEDVFCLLELL